MSSNRRPRRNALQNASIVFSSLAAVLTAGPALSGPEGMQDAAEALNLRQGSSVWQPLCIAAFVVALLAAVAANLHRSHDLPAQIATAEACSGELESLLATLDFDDLPVHDAVEQYQQAIHKIPFVKERSAAPRPAVSGRRKARVSGPDRSGG